MKRILQAAYYAAQKHSQQRRKEIAATPYINHPLEVAKLLAEVAEVTDDSIIIAALLHDTLEDTATLAEEIAQLFGAEILAYVVEVTDDKSLSKNERKRLQIERASTLSDGAKLIKLADKISNVRSVAYTPPQEWPFIQQQEYVAWAYLVYEGLRGVNLQLDALFLNEHCQAIELIHKRLIGA